MMQTGGRWRAGMVGALMLGGTPGTVLAQSEDAVEEPAAVVEEVVVTGRRVSQTDLAIGRDEVTSTTAVTREELLSAPAGISGLKMLENLPGFNVQTDGALGLYEFGNSVHVRAFELDQIGFVLDGVPMGRSDAFGGSPIFRYVDNENLRSVVASPGAGDVTLPAYASLGPMISYNTTEPSSDPGITMAITVGQFDLERSFIKLETGDIGGFSAYISRSKTDSELWRGPGTIDREHIESKVSYAFDDDTYLLATYVSNEFYDYDSPSGPENVFDADYEYGYLPGLPTSCIDPQPGVYDFNGDGVIDDNDFTPVMTDGSCTSYYEDRINIRDDELFSLQLHTNIATHGYGQIIAYYEDKDGYGVSPDSYGNSRAIFLEQQAAGLDVTHPRGVQYGLSTVGGDRKGLVADLDWQLGNHMVTVGGWYEEDTYNRSQQRLNKTAGSADGDVIWSETAYFRRDYTSVRKTTQLYFKDTMRFMDDRFNVEVGFKALDIDFSLDGYRDYADYEVDGMPGYGPQSVGADYSESFLPTVGAVFDLNDRDQIFVSYARNFALPAGADDIFSVATSFEAPAPEGEEADNYEIGIRMSRPTFNGQATLYYSSFDNRLLPGSVINPATGQPEAAYVNGGETEAYGVELSGVYQPEMFESQVYFDANLTYNHAELVDGFGSNPAGSLLADSPEWLFTGGVTYEPTSWMVANMSVKYTGKRYADYAESVEMDDYTVVSAYLDLGGENPFGIPENISLRFNVDNLFDEEALSFVFAGSAFYRPLNVRTFQATLSASI